jgi:transposase-like protein
VIADAYLAGVSTRRVDKLVRQLGVEGMSKSLVSRLAKSLEAIVEDVRPLEGGPYPYLVLDALAIRCREGGRTVSACVVHAVAVNRDGFRCSLGLDVRHAGGRGRLACLPALARCARPLRREARDLGCAPRARRRDRRDAARGEPGSAAGRSACAPC